MSQKYQELSQLNWPVWERLFGVLTKVGVDLYQTKKDQRSQGEQSALNAIHGVLNSHYDLVHVTNLALKIDSNASLNRLVRNQNRVSSSSIRNLMKAFEVAQASLEPVRPLIAKEIMAAFESDQAATEALAPIKADEPVSRPRRRRHKLTPLAL